MRVTLLTAAAVTQAQRCEYEIDRTRESVRGQGKRGSCSNSTRVYRVSRSSSFVRLKCRKLCSNGSSVDSVHPVRTLWLEAARQPPAAPTPHHPAVTALPPPPLLLLLTQPPSSSLNTTTALARSCVKTDELIQRALNRPIRQFSHSECRLQLWHLVHTARWPSREKRRF